MLLGLISAKKTHSTCSDKENTPASGAYEGCFNGYNSRDEEEEKEEDIEIQGEGVAHGEEVSGDFEMDLE